MKCLLQVFAQIGSGKGHAANALRNRESFCQCVVPRCIFSLLELRTCGPTDPLFRRERAFDNRVQIPRLRPGHSAGNSVCNLEVSVVRIGVRESGPQAPAPTSKQMGTLPRTVRPLHHPFDTPLQMPDISCTAVRLTLRCISDAAPGLWLRHKAPRPPLNLLSSEMSCGPDSCVPAIWYA